MLLPGTSLKVCHGDESPAAAVASPRHRGELIDLEHVTFSRHRRRFSPQLRHRLRRMAGHAETVDKRPDALLIVHPHRLLDPTETQSVPVETSPRFPPCSASSGVVAAEYPPFRLADHASPRPAQMSGRNRYQPLIRVLARPAIMIIKKDRIKVPISKHHQRDGGTAGTPPSARRHAAPRPQGRVGASGEWRRRWKTAGTWRPRPLCPSAHVSSDGLSCWRSESGRPILPCHGEAGSSG